MPTPPTLNLISVKCANLSDGEYVKITNLSANATSQLVKVASGEAVLNIANLTGWSTGNTISIETQGRIVESSSTTISTTGGTKVTLSSSTAASDPAVDM
ncbi:hypothetical protein LCGC14_0891780 [marine sediment metagenome]|uniref:Uncharacterized protein n=1 Tax=marine sediment metagenome TaxID=412755 RepID=A0A0F9PJR4_9ZZZZ